MTIATITSFEKTVEKANHWLAEIMSELALDDPARAYRALRVVLHAVRDRLSVQEVADLGAQLPMLLRGLYYEGWTPSSKPPHEHRKEQFLAHIGEALQDDFLDPETAARSVLLVLSEHVTEGEIDDVKGNLPLALRELWPA